MATVNTKAQIIMDGVDKTRAMFASVSKNFDDVSGKVTGFTGKLGAVGAGVAIAIGALESIKIINVLDQLDDLQEKTGISVEKLSELRFAGEAVGTPLESLTSGVSRLSKQMVAAASGNKEATATFDALNISVTNADGSLRSSDEVLGDLADRFATYSDGAEKSALAQRIFGKSGADMIPILNQGRAGIKALGDEAKQLGVIYGGDLAKNAADFNDNLTKIKLAAEGASVQIGGPLIKSLARLSEQYLQAIKDGKLASFTLGYMGRMLTNPVATMWDMVTGKDDAKTTAQIQADVNRRNPNQASAGGGRGIILNAAPIITDPDKKAGGSTTDPLAEAKRYLESLQKQGEKLAELSVYEEALLSIQKKRLGTTTPALEKEILDTARLIDLKKADTDSKKAAEDAAKDASDEAGKRYEEMVRLMDSVATPAEKLAADLERIGKLAENNPLISDEVLARASTKAWQEYVATIDTGVQKLNQLDEFSQRAAENIQDQLGSGLNDILNGEFDNIGDGFVRMLNRMAAEAIAADLSRAMFGSLVAGGTGKGMAGDLLGTLGKSLLGGGSGASSTGDFARLNRGQSSGGGGDLFSGLASSFGGWLGGLMSFDVGTDYVPFDMVAKVHEGERIVPAAENRRGGGGGNTYNNFTVNGAVDRRSQGQIAGAAYSGARRAAERIS